MLIINVEELSRESACRGRNFLSGTCWNFRELMPRAKVRFCECRGSLPSIKNSSKYYSIIFKIFKSIGVKEILQDFCIFVFIFNRNWGITKNLERGMSSRVFSVQNSSQLYAPLLYIFRTKGLTLYFLSFPRKLIFLYSFLLLHPVSVFALHYSPSS